MGSCDCEGGGDCKTCGTHQFASSLVKTFSKNYKTKEERDRAIESLGDKKVGKDTYVMR